MHKKFEGAVGNHLHDPIVRVEKPAYETGTLQKFWNEACGVHVLVRDSPTSLGMPMEDVAGLVQDGAYTSAIGRINAELVRDVGPAIIGNGDGAGDTNDPDATEPPERLEEE